MTILLILLPIIGAKATVDRGRSLSSLHIVIVCSFKIGQCLTKILLQFMLLVKTHTDLVDRFSQLRLISFVNPTKRFINYSGNWKGRIIPQKPLFYCLVNRQLINQGDLHHRTPSSARPVLYIGS